MANKIVAFLIFLAIVSPVPTVANTVVDEVITQSYSARLFRRGYVGQFVLEIQTGEKSESVPAPNCHGNLIVNTSLSCVHQDGTLSTIRRAFADDFHRNLNSRDSDIIDWDIRPWAIDACLREYPHAQRKAFINIEDREVTLEFRCDGFDQTPRPQPVPQPRPPLFQVINEIAQGCEGVFRHIVK